MIIEYIGQKLQKILDALAMDTTAKVIVSNRKDLCDYQFDGSFALAKQIHKNPFDISEEIVNNRYTLTSTVILRLDAGDVLQLGALSFENITYPNARMDIEKID